MADVMRVTALHDNPNCPDGERAIVYYQPINKDGFFEQRAMLCARCLMTPLILQQTPVKRNV